MDIPIDPEAINKMVADAILKSAIGDALNNAIAREMQNISSSYNNPLEKVVRDQVAQIIRDLLCTQHGAMLRQKVSEALTEQLTSDFVLRVCEAGLETINRGRDR